MGWDAMLAHCRLPSEIFQVTSANSHCLYSWWKEHCEYLAKEQPTLKHGRILQQISLNLLFTFLCRDKLIASCNKLLMKQGRLDVFMLWFNGLMCS